MSNFYIPRDEVTAPRLEHDTDSQLAKIERNIRWMMGFIRDAQSIRHDNRHHEMFDLAERIGQLARECRGL